MFSNKKRGDHLSYLECSFIWAEDTCNQNNGSYCFKCNTNNETYRVKNFPSSALSKVLFCIKCDSVVSKPEKLLAGAEFFWIVDQWT
jgi:hypothetical protein